MYFYIVLLIVLLAAVLTVVFRKLTIAAAVIGVAMAMCIFVGASYTGLIMLASFFVLATVATTFGIQQKQKLGFAESNRGKRNAAQVLANGGIAAILGLSVWIFPQYYLLFSLMIAASFSSATADTLSSELGNVFGKNFYNIVSFKKDIRGLNGVISQEGTLYGLAGSIIIAAIYALGNGFDFRFLIVVIAGTIGNFFDSVLGATLENNGAISNNSVNFLNTLLAALFGGCLYLLFI